MDFHRGIGFDVPPLLFGVMHRAIGIGAHLADFALLAAVGDNRLGGVLAGLVLRRVLLMLLPSGMSGNTVPPNGQRSAACVRDALRTRGSPEGAT